MAMAFLLAAAQRCTDVCNASEAAVYIALIAAGCFVAWLFLR